ncbi:hypothetical protein GQ42DRAFT_161686 [Ramicandelaber brevisporus]|nr:hypothetical protein GQ42DRAFT_161686 [Ramicandelaber brevisporus]
MTVSTKATTTAAAAAAAAAGGSEPDGAATATAVGNPTTVTTDEQLQNLDKLINTIESALGTLLDITITAHDFQPDSSNPVLHRRINDYIADLAQIDQVAPALNDVRVPMAIVDAIDNNRNPDVFTTEFIDRLAGENQFAHGKTVALSRFRDALASELNDIFPEDMEEYNEKIADVEKSKKTSASSTSSSASA